MKQITLKSIVCADDDLRTIDIDDSLVIEHKDRGDHYGVELIGGRIWNLLGRPLAVAKLCETLLLEYDVDRKTCEQDVLEFLNDLMRQGLIRTAD